MDASIDIPIDRFTNLANSGSATMLVLAESLGLTKGATLTINEVDEFSVPTGRIGTGLVAAISGGQFYSLPTGYNQYYLNPLNMANWVDYSSISTVVGWSSFTSKYIFYKIEGDTLFWNVLIEGTSDSTSASFTLPSTLAVGFPTVQTLSKIRNSGTISVDAGLCAIATSSDVMNLFRNITASAWTNSGGKSVYAQGFYKI